ncbi:uncharacterized protein CBL_08753 [Carabus blaptoides fortunei]
MKYFSVVFVFIALCVIFVQCAPDRSVDKVELSDTQICRQPMIRGRCRAAMHKVYYDAGKEECLVFLYGGCGGNENNFRSKEDCEAKCSGVKAAEIIPTDDNIEIKL